jgi:Integrase core domain.
MESILTENGGEFSSDEMKEVTSILNVEDCTTAAYSPFQNGLYERIHSVTSMCY